MTEFLVEVVKIREVPKQELWRAVPSSGHILCVIGISSLREITCKTRQEKTEEAILYNEALFHMLYMLRRLKMILFRDLSGRSL